MNRRKFLALAGGGVVVAAGGAASFALTRTPHKALAPWETAGGEHYTDPRMRALSYAILAPNPHNRQPWIASLKDSDEIVLTFDTSRRLPQTDPFDRQLTIGLGCFLELLKMAAHAGGHAVETKLFPEGSDALRLDDRPVAHIRLRPGASIQADPLWAHVGERRSNKEPFDTARPVPNAALDKVLAAGANGPRLGGSIEQSSISELRQISERAMEIELDTPRTYKESVDLFRIGKCEVNANPDGIDFTGPMFETLGLFGLFSREVALDPTFAATRQGREAVLETCRTAMGHVWMTTPDNTRIDQIAAGRDWLRVNLAATAAGLGFQPLSQTLQEYKEMSGLYRGIHDRLAADGGTVQMLARIGYGPQIPVSPRWPIESRMANA